MATLEQRIAELEKLYQQPCTVLRRTLVGEYSDPAWHLELGEMHAHKNRYHVYGTTISDTVELAERQLLPANNYQI